MHRLALAMAAITLLGCPTPREPAIRVEVHFGTLRPGCLEIIATEAQSPRRQSKLTVLRAQLDSPEGATIAVFPGEGWDPSLELLARSFEHACKGTPVEEVRSAVPVAAGFAPVPVWELTLAAKDTDGDGFAPPQPGVLGTDCNDDDPLSSPTGTESCDGSDHDCDGLVGCQDPDCGTCNRPPTACHGAPGACLGDGGCAYTVELASPCDGGRCRSDGTCAPGEADCHNGLDDDGDGKPDCLDSDCATQSCDDRAPCTVNDLCRADGGCAGSALACTTPPSGQCWGATGACDAGACVYPATTGAACIDGDACTTTDLCRADGGCLGTSVSCSTPPNDQCYSAAGQCLPAAGDCSYAVLTGIACNDGNACSASDTCKGTGACSGTAYTCPAPANDCFDPGVCAGDGGCTFAIRVGAACNGGVCNGAGTCLPTAPFPYVPSNFNPSQHTPSGAVSLSGTCAALFDSSGATPAFTTWCGGPQPTIDISGPFAVLSMNSLSISSGASLTLVGSRPVILAVYGDALINGPVQANSVGAAPARTGAGGSPPTCPGEGGLGSDQGSGGGGGGGAGNATDGGNGGTSNNNTATLGAGGATWGGTPSPLRGGCPGGTGGASGSTTPAAGGAGGGALQLSAAGLLEVDTVISVSGAGGAPGSANGGSRPGGGGGGSGGMLVLEADRLKLTSNAKLTANAGGGGGGANNATASPGQDGPTDSASQALGGLGESNGGNGGNGGLGGSSAGPPGNGYSSNRGGGGGGGATGWIFLRHSSSSVSCDEQATILSPPPTRSQCP